jgi:hypothetical protein
VVENPKKKRSQKGPTEPEVVETGHPKPQPGDGELAQPDR